MPLVALGNIATKAGAEGGLTVQHNVLRSRMQPWEKLQAIYMPGLLQYQTSAAETPNAVNSTHTSSQHPEDMELWLPSSVPATHRARICIADLPSIEEQLRTAQCYDALDGIRHVLKIKSWMIFFKNKNVQGQREGTRSRTIINRVHDRARAAAIKYRAARQAKLALSGPGEWESDLRILADADVRAYQDPNQFRPRTGRRGTLEDDQVGVDAAADAMEGGDELQPNILLLPEARERRDGTGETCRTLSWIWMSSSRMPNPADETDDILRSEWAKSRARVCRSTEEVLLLKEEMRRTLQFLEWKGKWWMQRQSMRTGISKELAEGLCVYANGQANLQQSLSQQFRALWLAPLHNSVNDDPEPGTKRDSEGYENDNEEDSDSDSDGDGDGDGGSGGLAFEEDDEEEE